MTHQDSWPPVSNDPRPLRAKVARWIWIPAILVVPFVGWGAYASTRAEKEPPAKTTEDALGALVPAATPSAVVPAALPRPVANPKPELPVPSSDRPSEPDLDDPDEGESEDGDEAGGEPEEDDSAASAADDGSFWIQVASVPLKEKADQLANKLSKKGHNAQSSAYGGPRTGWWHVVRIGPYVTRLEAEKAKLAFVRTERMASAVVPRAHGPYHIQVASLRSESGAKKMAGRLNRLGHNARVSAINTRTRGTWYTVRVGPFDFESDVLEYKKLLAADGVEGEVTPRPESPPEQPVEPPVEPSVEPLDEAPIEEPSAMEEAMVEEEDTN